MPIYCVTYESKKEVVVIVEASDRKSCEQCVADAGDYTVRQHISEDLLARCERLIGGVK